jgi:DNA mismatch repair protein MutH
MEIKVLTISPPNSEAELLARAHQFAGLTLEQIAQRCQKELPNDLRRNKGWVGQLFEQLLGASAGCLPLPDFPNLGVELKTLPVDTAGKPLESTFISIVPLQPPPFLSWETSEVRGKLTRILWVPIQAQRNIPLAERQVGTALLWSPSAVEEAQLRADWQELTDMVAMGQLERITAHLGKYLQIRPKGANAQALCWGFNEFGEKIQTLPRGFYLRPSFTRNILRQYYL